MRSTRGFISVLAVSVCALALVASSAGAATVANTNDSGPGSLRQAVLDATPGETITVPAGDYLISSAPIAIQKSLTISGAGAGNTNFHGANILLFNVQGSGVNVTVSGVSFNNNVRSEGVVQGGLIRLLEGNLTLDNVVFSGNRIDTTKPAGAGGVIQGGLILATNGSLTIQNSRISGNTFAGNGAAGFGGGVIQGGAILYTPGAGNALAIVSSSISNNSFDVRGGQGPASASQNGGTVQGGSILISGESTTTSSLRGSTIGANTFEATAGPGGKGGVIQGGAILAVNAPFDLVQSTIAANLARTGDGVVQGAGASIVANEKQVQILSATIAGNVGEGVGPVSSGGNLLLSGVATIANTVISGGSSQPGNENCFVVEGSTVTSKGFNLDSLDQCGFHAAGDRFNTAALLGPLGDNGGPTPTMVPEATSPLVDQGAAFGLGTDQRGVQRPIDFPAIANAAGGDGADIGAVELQPSNEFGWGKLKKNKKRGTALLTVNLPSPSAGTLTLTGKGLKAKKVVVNGAKTSLTMVVVPKGKVKKALRKKGKRKVAIKVTYAPPGTSAVTKVRKAKLVRKQHKGKSAPKR